MSARRKQAEAERHFDCGGLVDSVTSYGGDILARQCRLCQKVIDARCPGCGVNSTRLLAHIGATPCAKKPASRLLLQVFGGAR